MLAPVPAQPRSVNCKPNRKTMSAQSAVGRSLPTQSLLLEYQLRKGNRWTAIGIAAATQPPVHVPEPLTLAEKIERVEGAMTADRVSLWRSEPSFPRQKNPPRRQMRGPRWKCREVFVLEARG
jgi:hypothetical protein